MDDGKEKYSTAVRKVETAAIAVFAPTRPCLALGSSGPSASTTTIRAR